MNCIICHKEVPEAYDEPLLAIEVKPDFVCEYACCDECLETVTQEDVERLIK